MLFAKKAKSDNIESGLYQSEVFSYTYKKKVTLLVSQEWLTAGRQRAHHRRLHGQRLRRAGPCATSSTPRARSSKASACAVEKGFQGGGDRFRASGIPYKALAVIEKADENGFVFREE